VREQRTLLKLLWVGLTVSIARSAKHRYLRYSEGDFETFRPAGTTCCTDGVNVAVQEWTFPPCQILFKRCMDGYGTPKTEDFTKMLPNFGI